ncbi:hypothetical protein D9M70_501540 [compost metagenome]
MNRLAIGLALDVPERLVDAGKCRHMDRPAAIEAAAIHDLPMVFDQQRILADQVVRELVNRGFHRQGSTFDDRLAPADDALVRLDLQKQPAWRNDIGGELGDFHGAISAGCNEAAMAASERISARRMGGSVTFDGKLEVARRKVEHAHRTVARPRLVAQAQRLDQFAVNVDGFVTAIGDFVGGVQRELQRRLDNADELQEDLVVAGLEQACVKGDVGIGEANEIALAVTHRLPGAFEIGDFLNGGAFGGKLRRRWLDRPAGFQNAVQQVELEDALADPFKHLRIKNVPFVLVADDRTHPGTSTDHSL